MNLVTCTANCGMSASYDDVQPDGWMYIKADPPSAVEKPNITIKSHNGLCPGCIAAAKRMRVTGGTKFLPSEYDGGGKVDRQRNLFD